MAIRMTKKLPVKLTPEELEEVIQKHSDEAAAIKAIEDRKREKLADFRHERKPHVDEFNRLDRIKRTGVEEREVECEERESLVNGAIEVVRLDTGEVIETRPIDDEDDDDDCDDLDERQADLFGGAPQPPPPMPVLMCEATDVDGEIHPITPEQYDAARAQLAGGLGFVELQIVDRTVRVVAARGRSACSTCSTVNGHRPECEAMKREDAIPEADAVDVDANDTGAVAIAMMEGTLDVPPGDDVKPARRRSRKNAEADA